MMNTTEKTDEVRDGMPAPGPPASHRTEGTAGERPVVLLVDDVEDNLLALEAMLRRDDIEIVTASSGRAALEILLERDVALAVVDVQMPEIDGFALAELMRGVEKTRNVPIIFITAGSREVARVFKGYEAGAVDFLFKPLDEQILRSKIAVFVRLHMQRLQLIQAERMREMFVGILGHDLRNPLNGILISAQLVLRRSQDDSVRDLLARILRNSERMNRLIEQLLDVTRIRHGGGVALSPAPTDLRVVVEHVVEELTEHRERFRLDVEGDTVGTWDVDRLAQVISNLLGNAVQHSPPGTPILVRVNGTRAEMLVLEVHNSGPGIPIEIRDVVFEPFRGRKSRGGLGLGLFVCKQFVAAHGGRIEFESSDQTGTCFRVRLPRDARATPAAATWK
jgi:signal transduction histidine kinase